MVIFYRRQRNTYYAKFGENTRSLGTDDREEAERRYQKMLRDEPTPLTVTTLWDLVTAYVTDAELAPTTKRIRRGILNQLVKYWNGPAEQLTAQIVNRWLKTCDANKTTRHSHIGIVKSLYSWSLAQGLIQINPIEKMKRPRADKRELFLTDDDVKILLETVQEPFKTLVVFGLETGARCSELLQLEARHVRKGHLLIPQSEQKTRGGDRTIWLSEAAQEIADRMASCHPDGKLFRNGKGLAWTKDAARQRLEPVSKKLGWTVRMTDLRHRFCIDRLTRGQNPIVVAQLMGHSNANMIYKVYGHWIRNPDLMVQAANF